MSHARIEEVSDSDIDSDPSEGDISDLDDDLQEHEVLKQRKPIVPPTKAAASSSLINPSAIPSTSANSQFQSQLGPDGARFQTQVDQSKYKDFQCIYPVYFDKNRSRHEGRRVGIEQAVENPLAREIVNACGRLGLETLFEMQKIHPKDWANPGRVKVKVKGNAFVKNKHHLYTLISKHLIANPTTEATAKSVQMPGLPPPDLSSYPKAAVPKGWKLGSVLPYYSPALSGGGVSDNVFKDMMGAGGQMPPGMPDMSQFASMMGGGDAAGSSEPKKPKVKRKIIRG